MCHEKGKHLGTVFLPRLSHPSMIQDQLAALKMISINKSHTCEGEGKAHLSSVKQ